MALTAAVSVASFSVVMAETFAAIGASTLVPATFIAGLRVAKGAGETQGDDAAAIGNDKMLAAFGTNPLKPVIDSLSNGLKNIDEIQLLLPRDARLHAEFEFEASDSISAGGSVGTVLQVVTVNAGFAALYESKSKNKITLDMNFVAVNVPLGAASANPRAPEG
jgi:hypothetical protein